MDRYCGHYYCKYCQVDWIRKTDEPSVRENCRSCNRNVNPYGMEKIKHYDEPLEYIVTFHCSNRHCANEWVELNDRPNIISSCSKCKAANIKPYTQQVVKHKQMR